LSWRELLYALDKDDLQGLTNKVNKSEITDLVNVLKKSEKTDEENLERFQSDACKSCFQYMTDTGTINTPAEQGDEEWVRGE
jgi:predicted Zn-ribbon and HTH transcriptional regulator